MKIVICGAGLAGLTLANRVSALGGEVVVLERAQGPRGQGYMMDFFGAGYDAIEAMGLLPAVEEVAYHLTEASFLDEHGRRRTGIRPSQLAAGPLLNIMRPDLERVLREALPSTVDLRFGTGPSAVADEGDSVRLTLDDGSEIVADLLVGADGVHSTVRGLVFGDESRFLRYLGFHTAAFSFQHPQIHAILADRACLTDTIGAQMGFYPLRDGRVASFAMHRTPDPTLPADVLATLREAYGGLGWVVPEALEACPAAEDIYYDQVAQIEMPAWSKGRVVLVGDACYAVSLLAAQGASLGVAGAYVLADRLARIESVERALVGYEQLWRPVVEEKQRVGRAAANWFIPESRTQLWVRRASLRIAGLPLVDRAMAKLLGGNSVGVIKTLERSARPPRLSSADSSSERGR